MLTDLRLHLLQSGVALNNHPNARDSVLGFCNTFDLWCGSARGPAGQRSELLKKKNISIHRQVFECNTGQWILI